jgi:Papain-like cysteine protease AvrRpt2
MPLRVNKGEVIKVARSTNAELLSGFSARVAALPAEPVKVVAGPGERIGVPQFHQYKEMWCWAACAEMVLRFLGGSLKQCDIAARLLRKDCCNNDPTDACDEGLDVEQVDQAFARVGLAGQRFDSELSFDSIVSQISGRPKRPVVAGIKWANGGGHLVVISGWRRADAIRYVKVNDPFYSSGDIRYEDLVERYGPNDTGRWTNTWADFSMG